MSAMIRRAFSHFPLRVVITTVVLALLVMTAGVTWFLTFRNGQRSIREIAEQMGRQGMENVRQRLESYLSVPTLINEMNLFTYTLGDPREVSPGLTTRKFVAEIGNFTTVISVAYANEQGEYLGISRGIEGVPLDLGISGPGTGYRLEGWALSPSGARLRMFDRSAGTFDPRTRPWYRTAVIAGKTTWTPVYLWISGDAGIDAVTPVFDSSGKLRGVLDTSLTLSGMGSFLKEIRVTPHSEAFIMDRFGMLVAASTVANPFSVKENNLERPPASESEDPVVRFGARTIARELGSGDGIRSERQFSLRIGSNRQIMHVAPFQDGPGVDWLIAEVIPESDFAQNIYHDMRSTAIFVAVFLLLSGFIALLLARRVTAPLELLSSMARSLAAGDLTRTIAVEGSDEVSELAASFNHMAAELRTSFASLAESEARYRAFLANNAAGIFRFEARVPMPLSLSEEDQVDWLYDNFVMAEHNEAALDVLGFSPDAELVGKNPGVWLPRSDPASLDSVRAIVRSSFQIANAEGFRHEPDRTRWFLNSVSGVVEHGSLVRIWGVVRDISDRKEAEEALRQSEVRYRRIFHRSAVSLWEVDISELRMELARLRAAGHEDLAAAMSSDSGLIARALSMAKVVDVNETTLRLFEAKSRDELLGPLDVTFDPAALAGFVPQAIGKAEKGKQHDIETSVLSRTGRRLNVILHFYIPAEDERISTMLVSVVDITKRMQAEEERSRLEDELRQAQKMESVGRLAGGISHDINNLLTPILGYAELLQVGEESKSRDGGVIILGAARRIRDLTTKLLAFSRKQRLAKSVVDLRRVVEDFEIFLRRTLNTTVEIRVEAPRDLGPVTVDVGQIEQVLMNLAINSQDAMPAGGVLTFALHEVVVDGESARGRPGLATGDYVCLTVSDTGTGMDEATRKRVFEPFFTTKELGKGTGLGLSTVYGIVKQHGGHIEVDSQPGRGTSFAIYLPRHGGTGTPPG